MRANETAAADQTDAAATEPAADAIAPTKTHQVAELKHDRPLTTCRVDPTGRWLAAGAQDMNVHLWDLQSGKQTTLGGHQSWVRSIDFSADGVRMYTACWSGDVNVWDTLGDRPRLLRITKAHQGATRWVRLSPDGRTLATCGNDLLVKIWNAEDGRLLHSLSGHERHVYAVAFHPAGRHLVSQDLLGHIKVWDLRTGRQERGIDASVMTGYDPKFAADMGGARDLLFNADGSELASAGITNVSNSFAGIQDPIIVLLDFKTGKENRQLKVADTFKGIAWGVRYHQQDFVIGAGADRSGKGELWFFKPGQTVAFHTMKLGSGARGLDLLSDQRRLAVAHADGAVRIYQMTAKAVAAEAPADTTPPDKTG